jgi:ATP-dependent DNA helicase RecG
VPPPPSLTLDSPLSAVRGVGPARARALAAAGLSTVEDLLFRLPHRYEDRTAFASTAAAVAGGAATFRGKLRLKVSRPRRRLTLVRGLLVDETGALSVAWFNRPYLASQVVAEEDYLVSGTVRQGRSGPELLNPTCERATAASLYGGRIVPVYPSAGGVGPAILRRVIDALLAALDLERAIADPLPAELLSRRGLPSLGRALLALHAPDGGEETTVGQLSSLRSPAHQRLLYGELLELCLEVAAARAAVEGVARAHTYRFGEPLRRQLRSLLPFPLTGAQRRSLGEIATDLAGPHPMLRLLQGDVGSGKTLVAALALATAAESGLQGVLMVPTEILAEQHFQSLERLYGGRYRLALVTARTAKDPTLVRALAQGHVQIAVGTHALFAERIAFRQLGLAVIDEQHRFGVLQRALLSAKGDRPDLLVMTATPIPRTLARAAWGDLPVSTLDELPPGRAPVTTEVVPARQRGRVYRELLAELEADPRARAFVVFPRIGDGEGAEEETSIVELGERVRRFLAGIPAEILHGRLPAAEAAEAMRRFASGEARVLLATTAIEVGVDVPEATWMVIEGAERFGLAQLHQLRGRIGRGGRAGRCAALHGPLTAAGESRLSVFAATSDGFRIAEADLEIRGPGDLPGLRQAGLPGLEIADLSQPLDREWLEKALEDARELFPRLAEPALAPLRERLERVLARRERADAAVD